MISESPARRFNGWRLLLSSWGLWPARRCRLLRCRRTFRTAARNLWRALSIFCGSCRLTWWFFQCGTSLSILLRALRLTWFCFSRIIACHCTARLIGLSISRPCRCAARRIGYSRSNTCRCAARRYLQHSSIIRRYWSFWRLSTFLLGFYPWSCCVGWLSCTWCGRGTAIIRFLAWSLICIFCVCLCLGFCFRLIRGFYCRHWVNLNIVWHELLYLIFVPVNWPWKLNGYQAIWTCFCEFWVDIDITITFYIISFRIFGTIRPWALAWSWLTSCLRRRLLKCAFAAISRCKRVFYIIFSCLNCSRSVQLGRIKVSKHYIFRGLYTWRVSHREANNELLVLWIKLDEKSVILVERQEVVCSGAVHLSPEEES